MVRVVLVDFTLEELLARLDDERIVLDELPALGLELELILDVILDEEEDLILDGDEDLIRLLEVGFLVELLILRLLARLDTLGTDLLFIEVEARGTDLFLMDDLREEEEVFLVLD